MRLSIVCGSVGLLSFAVALLGGCAILIPQRAAEIQPPVLEALPFTAGVHYPAEFRNASKLQPRWPGFTGAMGRAVLGGLTSWEYPYGEQSVALLGACFQSMFESIVSVEAWPPPDPRGLHRVSAVMVPRLVDVGVTSITRSARISGFLVTVTYRIEMYTPGGALLETWNVRSPAKESDGPLVGEAIHSAMTEAVAQFVREFLERKEQIKERLSVPAPMPKDPV